MIQNKADLGPAGRYFGSYIAKIEKMYENNVKMRDNKGFIKENDFFTGYHSNEFTPDLYSYDYQLCREGNLLKQGGALFCDKCLQNSECEGGYIPLYP